MKKLSLILVLCLLLCACGAKPTALADGQYTVAVSTDGGTGKAHILSPAALEVKDGKMTVTLVWSSKNYDYMIVDGTKYEPTTYEGGSTFVLPLAQLGAVEVIGDTVAMSTPHEISYTLTFDAKTVEAVK